MFSSIGTRRHRPYHQRETFRSFFFCVRTASTKRSTKTISAFLLLFALARSERKRKPALRRADKTQSKCGLSPHTCFRFRQCCSPFFHINCVRSHTHEREKGKKIMNASVQRIWVAFLVSTHQWKGTWKSPFFPFAAEAHLILTSRMKSNSSYSVRWGAPRDSW